jgi:hypothetical protein
MAANRKGDVQLFECAGGGVRLTLKHAADISSIAFDATSARAVASSIDAPIYVWDLLHNPGKWDPSKSAHIWSDLSSTDAKRAYAAIKLLRTNFDKAIPFLKTYLKPATLPLPDHVSSLLMQLDAPQFRDREIAQRELSAIAELVKSQLLAAEKTANEEVRGRLKAILKTTESFSPESLRQIRCCEVLEAIATTDAKDLLRTWTTGPETSRLTIEAKQSLARLAERDRLTRKN